MIVIKWRKALLKICIYFDFYQFFSWQSKPDPIPVFCSKVWTRSTRIRNPGRSCLVTALVNQAQFSTNPILQVQEKQQGLSIWESQLKVLSRSALCKVISFKLFFSIKEHIKKIARIGNFHETLSNICYANHICKDSFSFL